MKNSLPPRITISIITLALLTGCGGASEDVLSPDHSAYAGLPTELVEEVINDPGMQPVFSGNTPEEVTSMVQINVFTRSYCRDLYSSYTSWITTGTMPEVPEVVEPEVPGMYFRETVSIWVGDTERSIASGDPESLKEELLQYGGCRDFPITSGRETSETIAEALLAGN